MMRLTWCAAVLGELVMVSDDAASDRSEKLRRVKAGLGAVEIDVDGWIKRLGLPGEVPSREEVFATFPMLEPPLSRTIIEDREDRA